MRILGEYVVTDAVGGVRPTPSALPAGHRPRSLPAAELASQARGIFGDDRVSVAADLSEAIDAAAALAEAGESLGVSIGSGAVLVTGSVVTVGEARVLLGGPR